MIDESSLKYPVADYLTSLEMPLVNIRLEYPHPHLKKRQIDLITTNNPPIKGPSRIETAFEFKLAQSHTKHGAERNRIFNDLMRLYLLSNAKSSSAYFVVAGAMIDFMQNFRSIPLQRPTPRTTNNKDKFHRRFYRALKVQHLEQLIIKTYRNLRGFLLNGLVLR